ncbi:uncharacterized protein (DUF427 family) [Arthrobacter silviterrae]|uniref:DUF427 domain-containing protein n=1 Tax=Arthrobacter silviterrae TaxID=2026658 RepID=A0ABX0DAQ4_9MICC|nr:DUF427 domain-containing protein [Arthrobacter silviterrae]MDQ0278830.1 uncharacterized protein (DUF427 family) [Arthrobacter silviterrae]NGN83997.1 DUF427 domain-containing protein [Arthrobacter silviterrae]
MMTATFHGQVIARAQQTIYLEGNHYFPPESVAPGVLAKSWLRTLCYWKGVARYHHVSAGGFHSSNAAWSYPLPSPLARKIKGHVAFDQGAGVIVSGDRP